MKSYGGIIEQASSYSNLYESFDYVLRGTMRKTCPTGQKLLAHREEVIAQLQQELREGTFRISHYHVLVEDESAKEFKFFTNSEEMKQILDKTREAGEIPFRTVIRRKTFGEGKKKYCFT